MDFAILSQKLGIAENMPTVLLPEVFLAKNSRNVRYQDGRYDRIRGRLADLYDSEGVKIKAPTDVFVISAITPATKKLTITGDVLSGNTALADGATIRINGGTTAANNITFTVDGTPTYASPSSTVYVTETISAAGATPGNLFIGATPVLKYHLHIQKNTATERLLLGTKYHILLWSQSTKALAVKWTNTVPASVERWEIKDHLRNVVATNNVDFVLWWNVDNSVGNDFAALDAATGIDYEGTTLKLEAAKHIASYESYLFLGYTTENSTVYPQRVRWASFGTGGDDIDFDENGAGDAGRRDFTTSSGFLMGFALHGNDLVISKSDSMHRAWLITADTVFGWEEYALKVGNLSADSLVNHKDGRLYWAGSDLTIREINTPIPISIAFDVTIKALNTAKAEFIQATYINELEEIWWAIPNADSDTNDIVIAFHPDSGRSFIYDIPIRAFGDFTQQESYSYDTLPYGAVADGGSGYPGWGIDWLIYDTARNIVGFPLDIASDYLGNTFDLHRSDNDDGSTWTGNLIISTTLTTGKSLNVLKRVNNGAYLVFTRKSSGSATLYCKRDTEKTWQELGTVSLTDSDGPETVIVHVPFDVQARSFQYKIESSDVMEFLGMFFTEIEIVGNR